MVGSEVYSSEVKKTEVLMENFRRAIGENASRMQLSQGMQTGECKARNHHLNRGCVYVCGGGDAHT
jgi:DNA helicase TIP49 (TBP-interacting protein)